MNVNDLLIDLIDKSNLTKADLARALGVTPQAVSNALFKPRNTRVNNLAEMLDVLGYQLVVTNKGAKLPVGAEVISPLPKEEK